MRVLQINTVYGEKSTGRTCYEVNKALEKKGYEGYTAYGKGKHPKTKNTYRIGTEFEYYFHNFMSRLTGLQGYYSFFATKRLLNYIKKTAPDIIHLRNLHANYINLPLLFNYFKNNNIPVVLNLHDCWAITGKCAHFTDVQCFKWKTQCYSCPVVKNYPKSNFFDMTPKLYKDKKKWFEEIKNLTVIGVSKWTSDQAKMSYLFNRDIHTIYNWINREVFYPRTENILTKYDIDPNKFIILGVSSTWTSGSPRFDDFMKLSNSISSDMQIVLVGQSNEENFPDNIKHINFVENTNELAKLYSSADVYVHLSTEDTFGKVVVEAMACGVPSVVYNSTALPELIENGCGYVVEKRNVQLIKAAIERVKNHGKEFYSANCIARVESEFDYSKNSEKLIELYENILMEK